MKHMKQLTGLAAFVLALILTPVFVRADAASDLAEGRAALAEIDFDRALPLLTAAAQALPQSVEARLALAECHLRIGNLDAALVQYQAVAGLSPQHIQATRMIKALTGRRAAVEKQIAAARAQLEIAGYDQAAAVLTKTLGQPLDPAQRNQVQLLLAQAKLWGGRTEDSLEFSLAVIQDVGDSGPAHVLAALALVLQKKRKVGQAIAMLAEAGETAGEWKSRRDVADAMIRLAQRTGHKAASRTLAVAIDAIPDGPRRQNVKAVASTELMRAVESRLKRGDLEGGLGIVWPMISDAAEVPDADAVLKPLTVNTGWLTGEDSSAADRQSLTSVLASLSRAEFVRDGMRASLLGHWLVAQLSRNDPALTLQYAAELASFSRSLPGRQTGTVLGRADAIQREMLIAASGMSLDLTQQAQLVELIAAHLNRYAAVKDLVTGLGQFVTIAEDGTVTLAGQLAELPAGAAQNSLLAHVAQRCGLLGSAEFQAAQKSVVAVNIGSLSRYDLAMLRLRGRLLPVDSADRADRDDSAVLAVFERLAMAAKWDEAARAMDVYYSAQPAVDGRWPLVRLKIRRAVYDEDQRLAARRTLGEGLSDAIQAALADAITILEDGSEWNRAAGIDLTGSLITRYSSLSRSDLAEAVLATVADPKTGAAALSDWTLWTRAQLLDAEANRTLQVTVRAIQDRSQLNTDPRHVAELKLLAELIQSHPTSPFAVQAVGRVIDLSMRYHACRAWSAATKIPADFMLAVPDLASVDQLQYRIVEVQLGQAGAAFLEQTRTGQAPAALIPEDVTAIDALANYLKTYPVGDAARQAEDQLFAIARRYGQKGGWSATRKVLDQFEAAIPDFRSPAHLKLLQAATFVGELDRNSGLALLFPTPRSPAAAPGKDGLEIAGIAKAGQDSQRNEEELKSVAGGIGGGAQASRPASGRPQAAEGAARGKAKVPADVSAPNSDVAGNDKYFSKRQPSEPAAYSLTLIRQAQQQQFQQLAMLEGDRLPQQADGRGNQAGGGATASGVVLPSGTVLSEAEMKRQDDTADAAYRILIELVNDRTTRNAGVASQAREQVLWLFGFFEGNLRADRAIALIGQYLKDHAMDPERVALAYRIVTDRLSYASRQTSQMDLAEVVARHAQFEQGRQEIEAFVRLNSDETGWINTARLLTVDSYLQEAALFQNVSLERTSGLRVQAADALLTLHRSVPAHPQAGTFAGRLWAIAELLSESGQNEAAVRVLRHIAVSFPISELAGQSMIRTAQLYAANLADPIRAVETYQEYLSKTTGDPSVPTEIFNIASQLTAQQRYLEALHVYGVFVDSFPTDTRAAAALHAIGQTHQQNGAWQDAIDSYERVFEEYPGEKIVPQTRLAVAECRINLGEWSAAKDLYASFVTEFPKDGQAAMSAARIDVLKKLSQFQDLLADDMIDRNKDDAQFQIGRTVLTELKNPIKAVEEFRKVVNNFRQSDLSDDAQLEIGRTLLSLNQLDAARRELLSIPVRYANSPLADDALHLVGQSYETQAIALAGVTLEKARQNSFVMQQRSAYSRFRRQSTLETARDAAERGQAKKEGNAQLLALSEANQAWRRNSSQVDNLFCNVTQAEIQAETETALQIANRQDRINDAYREAVGLYARTAADYPLGDMTDRSLTRVADILETKLKDRPAAMQTYQRIVKLFPGTPVAEDAAWKVAVFHVEESQYAQAVEGFQTFIRNYPASSRVADAQFAMAEVLEQMGRWNDAMDAYEVFRQKFARHPKVQLASRQITWIKTYRK